MKIFKTDKNRFSRLFSCLILILLITCETCFAGEEISEGRKLYNSIMLWVNLGLMILWIRFLLKKFLNKSIVDILRGEGDRISEKLQEIESDLKVARSRMEEEADKLKSIDDSLEEITENILALGKREKNSIIEKARTVADKMVEDAKKEAAFKMEAAKKRFSEEMLELAVSITIEKIKNNLTEEDDENLVISFSSGLNAEKINLA